MVKRHGGTKATESAVDLALQWLAYHQEPDGHWDTMKYAANGKVDTGLSALALLAFLGAGHTEKVGQYKENVQLAVGWLKNQWKTSSGYHLAMTALALSEAAGMADIPDTRTAAQNAIDFVTEVHQQGDGSEKGAWRYGPKPPVCDISVSGWFIMALKSAKVSKLKVNQASFEGAWNFLNKLEIKNSGPDNGYGPASRYYYTYDDGKGFIVSKHRDSAIGILCRQFLGAKKDELQSSVELFVSDGGTPVWGDNPSRNHPCTSGGTDLYYWYYGTLAVFQQGGDVWKRWNEDMKKALVVNQCKQGDNTGSWDVIGVMSERWGRVGQTALGALCLEVYYRYLQLTPER